jgi:hypothetical protein
MTTLLRSLAPVSGLSLQHMSREDCALAAIFVLLALNWIFDLALLPVLRWLVRRDDE